MSEARTGGAGAPADGSALEPALVLCFNWRGEEKTRWRRIHGSGALLLGRDQPVFDEPLGDPRMSVRHAELHHDSGHVLLRDLGSEAGTYVNGHLLGGEHQLTPGDAIRLGDTLLVYAPASSSGVVATPELVAGSAVMAAVLHSVDAVAPRKHSVVVTGATGTGKEVVARLVHQRSGRTGPFLAVNCGTFTEGLIASDLFGHVRGAFTGAVSEQLGLFRAAHGGTLLLDEVAEFPLSLQANLLRVVEMHQVRPVGGTQDIHTDVRVIATSNQELMELVRAGRFRSDLYSRLAQWTIRLPPLRERREDVPALTSHLLARCDGEGRRLSADLAEALLLHDWPLNVRGLLSLLSVAVVSTPESEPLALGPEVRQALATTQTLAPGPGRGEPVAPSKEELIQLMAHCRGKVATAARVLGVTRPKLYRLLWAHEVDPAEFRAGSGPRPPPADGPDPHHD